MEEFSWMNLIKVSVIKIERNAILLLPFPLSILHFQNEEREKMGRRENTAEYGEYNAVKDGMNNFSSVCEEETESFWE